MTTANTANTVSFTDQSNMSSQALQVVQEAVKQGLITSYPDGSFRPDQPVTRKEMAALLGNALKLDVTAKAVNFNDTQESWALPYIEAVCAAGLMTVDPTGAFHPGAPVSHEEWASILVRVIGETHVQGSDIQNITDGGGGSSTTNPTPTSTTKHVPVRATVPPDQYGIVGSGDTLMDLKIVFFDADQDELSYHAVTSDVYVAEAEIANQQLTLKPKSAGSTQVFVTAEDGKGGRASVFFTYTVTDSIYSSTLK